MEKVPRKPVIEDYDDLYTDLYNDLTISTVTASPNITDYEVGCFQLLTNQSAYKNLRDKNQEL